MTKPSMRKLALAVALTAAASTASATLAVHEFFADANLSVDALGVDGAVSGLLQAQAPLGRPF